MNVYSNQKILHHLERVKQGKPVYAQWDITNRCNNQCRYCSSKMQPAFSSCDEWSFDEIKQIASELKTAGVETIEITGGGEPLCHPDCKAIFRHLLSMGFDIGLVTNGLLMDGELADILSGFAWVRFSIDAFSDDTHLLLKGTHKPNISPFLPVLKQYDCVVGASFIVQDENVDEIVPFAEWAKDAGFNNVRYSPCYSPHGLVVNKKSVIKAIDVLQKTLLMDGIDINAMLNRFTVPWLKQHTPVCYYSRLVVAIAANGCIYYCCATKNDNRFSLGNILNRGFSCVWNSRKDIDTNLCPACWMDGKNHVAQTVLMLHHTNFV